MVLQDLIRHDKPLCTGACAVYPYSPKVERQYRFTSRFGDEVLLSARVGDELWLPRALCPVADLDERTDGTKVGFPRGPKQRPDQIDWFKATTEFLQQGLSGVTVAGTGRGKTVCGFHVTRLIGRRTLVVVTKDDIYRQWLNGAATFLGLAKDRIGEIRQDKCEVDGRDFVVAMIHSLAKDTPGKMGGGGKYPAWIRDAFGLVIFDECFHPEHELLTQHGWKPVAEVTEHDRVMAFDAKSGACQFEPVLRTVTKSFTGRLIRIHGQKFHTITTRGHKQPIRRKRDSGWVLDRSTIDELELHSRVQLPIAGRLAGNGLLTSLEKLRIAFEADGHHLYTAKRTGLHTYRFAFRRERKIHRLLGLLGELGWDHRVALNGRGDTNITFRTDILLTKDFDWFDPMVDGSRNEQFLLEVQVWDGWCVEASGFWQHKSKDRAEWLQTLAQVSGRDSSVCKFDDNWRVRWSAPQTWLESSGLHREHLRYEGPVHCVTVPSGNVMTRLRGTISISGNCHRVPAEHFQAVASMFTARLRLGLSATPERADGKELLVYAHVGPVRVKALAELMVPKVLRFHSTWQCPRTFRVDPATGEQRVARIPHEPGKTTHIEKILAADPERNRLLAGLIHSAYRKSRHIVVFSTLLDHLKTLHRLLVSIGIPGKEIGYYVGCSTKADKAAREKAMVRPILLTTYGMMGEGTDIPWLDLGLMAIPRSTVEQPCGRIRREYPDKFDPVWMDVVDNDSPVFASYGKTRLDWYRRIGATVKLVT